MVQPFLYRLAFALAELHDLWPARISSLPFNYEMRGKRGTRNHLQVSSYSNAALVFQLLAWTEEENIPW